MRLFNVIVEPNEVTTDILCDETEIKKIAATPQGEDCILKRAIVPKSKIIAVIPDYNGRTQELEDNFAGIDLPVKKPEPYSGSTEIPAFTRRAPGQKPARWRTQDAPPLSAS